MNLKKYIQSEIKSQLSESGTFDLNESLQGELDIMAKEAKDLKSFVKAVYKEFDNLPRNRDSLKWLTDIYKDSTNESVNEAKDNLYLQLHKKYAESIKGLKAKKISKLTDLVSVQRWSMEDREDYFDMNPKKKKELSAEYDEERKLFKKYLAGNHSVLLRKGTESLAESVNEVAEPQIRKIAELTGVSIDKVEKYVSSRVLNITKLLKYIKDEKQVAIRDFVKAVKGDKTQDAYFIKMFNESVVTEGAMSELDILAKEAKDLKSFVKTVFKEFDNLPKNKETLKWLEGIYKDSTNESVNEAKKKLPKFKNIPSWAKYLAQHSDGEWYFYEETPTMIKFKDGSGGAWKQDGNQIYSGVKTDGNDWDKTPTYYKVKNGTITESVNEVKKYKKGDKLKIKLKNGKEFDLTFDSYGRQKGMAFGKFKDGSGEYDTKPFSLDTIKEEQLDEKLITFSNRAPYGQVVFMAGGAGSGKGFAIQNFIDSAGFKVRDVDEMKKSVGELDKLGKFSIDAWYKKYSKNLKPEEREHVEEFVLGKGLSISDVAGDLKNPNNVAALHYIVDAMGLKDSWLVNMLSGKTNKETLPNLLFDITAKKVSSISDVIKPLVNVGYDPNNIHLIWVLTDYHLAVKQNKSRERVVPDDILLNTHEGAAKTIWSILTSGLPSGLNGRIDVILNNRENTVTYKDSKGNEMKGAVKGFLSLPIKKQGGGILPEKLWKDLLYKWILDNGPKTVDLRKPLDTQMEK